MYFKYLGRQMRVCIYLNVCWEILHFKFIFRNTIRESNSLDPDKTQHFVWPDLGKNVKPNLDPVCLQSLSEDDTGR